MCVFCVSLFVSKRNPMSKKNGMCVYISRFSSAILNRFLCLFLCVFIFLPHSAQPSNEQNPKTTTWIRNEKSKITHSGRRFSLVFLLSTHPHWFIILICRCHLLSLLITHYFVFLTGSLVSFNWERVCPHWHFCLCHRNCRERHFCCACVTCER